VLKDNNRSWQIFEQQSNMFRKPEILVDNSKMSTAYKMHPTKCPPVKTQLGIPVFVGDSIIVNG